MCSTRSFESVTVRATQEAAQHWWIDAMNCTTAAYSPPGVPHPGCGAAVLPARVSPEHLGLVIKISF